MGTEQIIGRNVLRYAQVDSTNTLAREFAERGETEGLVVTADEQTAGRGRLGRKWIVPPGTSLQFSVLLRPPFTLQHAARLMPMAALAVAHALENEYAISTRLKWPNDVLVADGQGIYRKVCGILVESSVQGDTLDYVILGIGLNVNYTMAAYPELVPLATTVQDAVGHAVDRARLEQVLFAELDSLYGRLRRGESLLEEYRARLAMLGQRIRVQSQDKVMEGIATDVDEDGALILMQEASRIKVLAGEVTVLKENKEVV